MMHEPNAAWRKLFDFNLTLKSITFNMVWNEHPTSVAPDHIKTSESIFIVWQCRRIFNIPFPGQIFGGSTFWWRLSAVQVRFLDFVLCLSFGDILCPAFSTKKFLPLTIYIYQKMDGYGLQQMPLG